MILEQLIPRYIEVLFYRILLESLASEHAARMNAMHNATENAQELAEAITELAAAPETCVDLARQGREKVLADFNNAKSAAKLAELFGAP